MLSTINTRMLAILAGFALLLGASVLVSRLVLERQADDALVVNLAGRQRMLTQSMTTIIDQLNAASATVRDVTTDPSPTKARGDLTASADALESGYR